MLLLVHLFISYLIKYNFNEYFYDFIQLFVFLHTFTRYDYIFLITTTTTNTIYLFFIILNQMYNTNTTINT